MKYLSFVLVLVLLSLAAGPALAEDGAWIPVGPRGGLTQALVLHPLDPKILWAGTANAGVFKSLDGAETWSPSSQGLPASVSIAALAVAPGDPETLYTVVNGLSGTIRGVFRSDDGGTTWAAVLSCAAPLAGSGCARLARTHELDVDPQDARTIYASTDRGVFKSVDGGVRWDRTGRFEVAGRTYALAIDPREPRVLYAGGNDGVSRSEDGGATWEPWNQGIGPVPIREIVIDPRSPRRIWAAGDARGVFRSTDGGARWQQGRRGLAASRVSALALAPVAGRNLPAVWAGTDRGVFRSLDGGVTWAESPHLHDLAVASLAAHPSRPGVVWVAAPLSFRTDRVPGIYKTATDGAAWRLLTFGLYGLPMTSLAFDPIVPGVIWASSSTSGVFRSGDGGITWQQRNGDLPGFLEVLQVEVDPLHPSTVWIGTSLGVFVSEDEGATWEARNEGLVPPGSLSFPIRRLRIAAAEPTIAYAATFHDLYRTVDGGEHWTRLPLPVSLPLPLWQIEDVLIDPRDPDAVFVAAQELWVTRDGGATWQQPAAGTLTIVTALAIDPRDPDTIYAAGLGLFRSTDGGRTWEGQPAAPVLDSSLLIVAGSLGDVWMGNSQGIYRSPDGETAWTRAPDLPPVFVREMGIDPFLNRVLAATSAGVFYFFPGVSP